MTKQEAYNTLGLNQSANEREVKSAYRRLAKEYHPDKTDGDDTQFKKISEAYAILSGKQQAQQEHSGWNWSHSGPAGINLDDIFGGFGFDFGFAGSQRPKKKQRPQPIENKDIHIRSDLTLDQVGMMGFRMQELPCKHCRTEGYVIEDRCNECNGQGVIEYEERYIITIKGEKQ
jgi:molecular chaperone DnaJ